MAPNTSPSRSSRRGCSRSRATCCAGQPAASAARAPMATILVVDDRPTNRQFLSTLLGYGGHRLLEAADGAEALRLVKAERPDLVISDILMPTMDGFEFAKSVR